MKKFLAIILLSISMISPASAKISVEAVDSSVQSTHDTEMVNSVGGHEIQVHQKITNPIQILSIKSYHKFRLTSFDTDKLFGLDTRTYRVVKWSFVNRDVKTIKVIRFFLVEVSPFGEPIYRYRFDAVGKFSPGVFQKEPCAIQTALHDAGSHWEVKSTQVLYEDGTIWKPEDTNIMDY